MISVGINKEESYIIKGIAILLMLVHHFFTFPQWIIMGGYTPNLQFAEFFNSPTKLCVCIFAFVSGWAAALGELTYRESARRIKKLLINYWWIAVPAIMLAVYVCGFEVSALDICKELLGLNSAIMIFAWYVPFYAVSMIVMATIQKWLDGNIKIALFGGVILPICIFTVMKKLPVPSEVQTLFNNLRHWFPCIAIGYICNKKHWFEIIKDVLKVFNRFLASAVLIVLCFVGRYFVSGLDLVYCLLLVFAIINLQIDTKTYIGKFLCICGRNSSNMWFLHCLYFGEGTRELIQPLAFWPKYPLMIYIVAIVELLCCSEIIIWVKKKMRI